MWGLWWVQVLMSLKKSLILWFWVLWSERTQKVFFFVFSFFLWIVIVAHSSILFIFVFYHIVIMIMMMMMIIIIIIQYCRVHHYQMIILQQWQKPFFMVVLFSNRYASLLSFNRQLISPRLVLCFWVLFLVTIFPWRCKHRFLFSQINWRDTERERENQREVQCSTMQWNVCVIFVCSYWIYIEYNSCGWILWWTHLQRWLLEVNHL
jgi:hypothetical protein